MKLKWKTPEEEFPPEDTRLLVKFKHGVIDCYLVPEESDKEAKTAVGGTYIWRDQEFYIYQWVLYSDFEKVCE